MADSAPVAPMPAQAPIPSPDTKTAKTLVPAPPLKTGTTKRYDEEQQKKLRKLKLYIENLTKISTVHIIEGYLRELHQNVHYTEYTLFQIIPARITHLCYKFCTQFKYYLILVYSKSVHSDDTPEIKMLGINDIERTNQDLSKQIKHLVPSNNVNKVSINSVRKTYEKHRDNTLLYIPQLSLSKTVTDTLIMDDKNIPLSGIFRCYSTGTPVSHTVVRRQRLEMLYFNSPYFYDYKLDMENNKKLLYNQFDLPIAEYPSTQTHSLVHIPFSNQLMAFSSNKEKNVVGVMDLYDMKWLTNKKNYNSIQLSDEIWSQHSLCLCENKVFLIGGVTRSKHKQTATNMVEILDCLELSNGYENSNIIKSVPTTSKMNVCRVFGSCDIVGVKNNQIVIGGGYANSWSVGIGYWTGINASTIGDNASNSVEFYDHNKDQWMLHNAQTQFVHQKARLWCSGNLLFITGGWYSQYSELNMVGNVGKIECIDIRDNANKWQVLDERDVQKLYCLYNISNARSCKTQGMFI